MQNVMFAPQGQKEQDVVAITLSKIAQNILIVVLGLSPLFFIPALYAPFNFTKVIFVVVGIFIALIFYSLSALREGKMSMTTSAGLSSAWALAAVVFAAAALSGDVRDSIVGDAFGIHTAIFVGLLALITSAVTILGARKTSIMHLYILLTGSGLVIGVYHVLRLLFGPNTLSLGLFNGLTSTPLGGWNDLALFFGLSLILALVAVEQFPLTKWGRGLFGLVSVLALVILSVVNFFAIWIVLGIVSLIVLMYSLTKNRFKSNAPQLAINNEESSGALASIVLSVIVFVFSVTFVVGGSGLGQFVSGITGISYVEVRPSLEATIDITRNVYSENAFTGIGPNKFADAWRQYKDPAINQTIFWNTPFEAGVGYIPTFAATAGIFGILAWLAFLGFIVRAGIKILFTTNHVDRFWRFIGISSFVSAIYLWGMSIVYVPGPAILILAAVFTGVLYTAYGAIIPQRQITLSLIDNRRAGFALVALTMVIIIVSVSAIYFSGRHYSGLLSFNKAIASIQIGVPIETIEKQIADSFELSSSDRFAREIVGLQLSKMNTLLAISEPTEAQQQQFQSIVVNAVNAGQLAVDADPTEPLNWQGLGNVYSILTTAGIEGAYDRAAEAFNNASKYDPTNPQIKLQQAQLESRAGNLEAAKTKSLEAINLKQNYTDAYFFISQVDIALGDVDGAIQSTLANITLEPRNSARYYQLGILYSSQGNVDFATQSFEAAISIDENYANARYFLALAYDEQGRTEDARAQLEAVLALNPGNASVNELIARLDRGESLTVDNNVPAQVGETEAIIGEDGEAVTTEDPDSPLLSPVNTVPNDSEDSELFEGESETLDAETSVENSEIPTE